MNSDGFAKFLESVIFDPDLYAQAQHDLELAVRSFQLSQAEIELLKRRLKRGVQPTPRVATKGLQFHYKSQPEDVPTLTLGAEAYITAPTDVTFDVKPNVVIPPPPTTITVPTPTPSPTPDPTPKPATDPTSSQDTNKAIFDLVHIVKQRSGGARLEKLEELARLLEVA